MILQKFIVNFLLILEVFAEKCLLLVLFLKIEKYIGVWQLIYHELQAV